jgi:hypothetical protein
MNQDFMIKGGPSFDVLNLAIQNQNFAKMRMAIQAEQVLATAQFCEQLKPLKRNPNAVQEVSQ